MSKGITSPPQAPTAIAANVAFATESGGAGNLPTQPINGLGRDGIVFFVSLYPRGEKAELDRDFLERRQRLQLSDAALEHGFEGIQQRIADYRLDVVPKEVVHPGLAGGWSCQASQLQEARDEASR
jgi:hypothetical protein